MFGQNTQKTVTDRPIKNSLLKLINSWLTTIATGFIPNMLQYMKIRGRENERERQREREKERERERAS